MPGRGKESPETRSLSEHYHLWAWERRGMKGGVDLKELDQHRRSRQKQGWTRLLIRARATTRYFRQRFFSFREGTRIPQ